MSFSIVQSNTASDVGSVAFSTNVAVGNLLVLVGGGYDSTAATGVTDTLGNTYTLLGEAVTGIGGVYFYYCITASSGANTLTVGGAGTTNMVLACAEVTVPASFVIGRDGFVSSNNSAYNNYTIKFPFDSSGTPSAPTEIMILTVFYDEGSGAHSWTQGSGTKLLDTNPGSDTAFLFGYYDTSSAPASVAISTFSINGDTVGVTMILYTPAAGGGGGGGGAGGAYTFAG